jgi:flavin-dependent dehydrogenase
MGAMFFLSFGQMPGVQRLIPIPRTTTQRKNLASYFADEQERLALADGSRIGVIGGGPAGSFFAYFLFKMARSIGLDISVDIYEPRYFAHRGPAGCNHCGGVVSESLVQLLAAEGINLPPTVVRRGIDSYVLHTDVGQVHIETPLHEMRIAAVYRGNGPKHSEPVDIAGFDRHLLDLSESAGAKVVRKLVTGFDWDHGRPQIRTADGAAATYDLVAVAAGVNSHILEALNSPALEHRPPGTLRAFISEFHLGQATINEWLGNSMHVFLLDIPRLEFAALIPKGDFATLCLLGEDVDEQLIEQFLATPEVKACFPDAVVPPPVCHCFPRINVRAAAQPFADRIVWIGDSGVNRLFKDGIGSAYRTAKAAAKTAVFRGIAKADFEKGFWPECKALIVDNRIAKLIFGVTTLIQRLRFLRRGVLRMTAQEQREAGKNRRMSSVLWDVFTGSAPYREILLRTFHPAFPLQLMWNLVAGNLLRAEQKTGTGSGR